MSLWGLESLKVALNGQSLFGTIEGVDFIDAVVSPVFDFDYLARSGNKCLKESFDSVLTNGVIPPSFMPTIGRLIALKYADKWNGLYRQSARMYDEQFNPLLTDNITVSRNLSSSDNSETQTSAKRLAVSSTDEKRTADETHERLMNEAANKAGERSVDDNRVTDRNYQEARQMSEKESRETNEDVSGSETHAGTESETGSKTLTKTGSVVDSGTSSTESMEKVDGNTATATERTGTDSLAMSDSVSGSTSHNNTGYTFGFNSSNPVETGRGNNSHTATEERDQAQETKNNFTEESAENKSTSTGKNESSADTHVQSYDGYSETETPNTQVTKASTVANESAKRLADEGNRESAESHTNTGTESEKNSSSESFSDTTGRNVNESSSRQNSEGKTVSGSESGETSENETAKRLANVSEEKTTSGYRNADLPDKLGRMLEILKGFNLMDIVYDDIDEVLVTNIFVA